MGRYCIKRPCGKVFAEKFRKIKVLKCCKYKRNHFVDELSSAPAPASREWSINLGQCKQKASRGRALYHIISHYTTIENKVKCCQRNFVVLKTLSALLLGVQTLV